MRLETESKGHAFCMFIPILAFSLFDIFDFVYTFFICKKDRTGLMAYLGTTIVKIFRLIITPILLIFMMVVYGIQQNNDHTDYSSYVDIVLMSLLLAYWLLSPISIYCSNSEE